MMKLSELVIRSGWGSAVGKRVAAQGADRKLSNSPQNAHGNPELISSGFQPPARAVSYALHVAVWKIQPMQE